MLDAICCEFMKLRKSYFYPTVLSVLCFLPVFLYLVWLGQGQPVEWSKYIPKIEVMAILTTYTPMFSVVSAYIFTREFSNNIATVVYAYPVSRIKIFLSKLVFLGAFMILAYFLQLLFIIVGGLLVTHEVLTQSILITILKANMYSLIFQYAIIPVSILIALLFKKITASIVYSGIVTIININLMRGGAEKIYDYAPMFYPLLSIEALRGKIPIGLDGGLQTRIIIAALTFITGITVCIIYYLKADVN